MATEEIPHKPVDEISAHPGTKFFKRPRCSFITESTLKQCLDLLISCGRVSASHQRDYPIRGNKIGIDDARVSRHTAIVLRPAIPELQ
jgi:hypothetical protein